MLATVVSSMTQSVIVVISDVVPGHVISTSSMGMPLMNNWINNKMF